MQYQSYTLKANDDNFENKTLFTDVKVVLNSSNSLNIDINSQQHSFSPCKLVDLINTDTFESYYTLEDQIKMDTRQIENLYVLENELENANNMRLRALTRMEICLLISMHLQYENDKKAYEMKINYNSSIFAHKFKSKSEKIVN